MTSRPVVAALTFSAMIGVPAVAQTPRSANGWPASTAQAEGLDPAPLLDLVSKAQSGTFGNTDRLVVIRNGKLVLNERFARDYREISRGKSSAIGCGIDACKDSTQLNHYNYLHPTYHPYWQGGEAHTLQSVTKSVAATVIGAAMQQGKIRNAATTTPMLSYFGAYDLSKVDPRLHKATLADLLTATSGGATIVVAWTSGRATGSADSSCS